MTIKSLVITGFFVTLTIGLFVLGSCTTDPIRGVKNNPTNMDIIMNHIATDDSFRELMVEKLTAKGDRMKLADKLVADEDFGKILMSRLLETSWGEEDLVTRVAGQEDRLKRTIRKALDNFHNKEPIIEALIQNDEMMEYMRNNSKFKEALAKE